MNWREFLTIAKCLRHSAGSNGYPEDAAIRSAISRAYYAAFHVMLAYSEAQGFYTGSGRGDHSQLQRALQQYGRTNLEKQAGRKLGSVCDARVRADYRLYGRGQTNLQNDWQTAEKYAGWIMQNF